MKRPMDVYAISDRQLPDPLPTLAYPLHDVDRVVRACGHLSLPYGKPCFLSTVLAGERVGLRELEGGHWLITFANLELGLANSGTGTFECTIDRTARHNP